MTTEKKIKIAAIKYAGAASGGTEKHIQCVAANLPKDRFEVDFYYCDASPYIGSDYKHPTTDPDRMKYLKSKGLNLIKFDVGAKNITDPVHPWIETNFWELFKESEYDIVITARAGHKEYPYHLITKTPIVEFVTLPGLADNQSNILKSVHISKFQANTWIKAGGDPNKIEIIPLFDELPSLSKTNLRKELELSKEKFVFGMHQRADDGIFSPIPLEAYSKIENRNTAFAILGGSANYAVQAKYLGLKNFIHIPHTGDSMRIARFLETLNVYSHGRADGETYSLAIAEAMYHGLPIISHYAPALGHIETIGDAGIVVNKLEDYISEMNRLMTDEKYYSVLSVNATSRFQTELSLSANIQKIVDILEKVFEIKNKEKELETMPAENFWGGLW